MLTAALFFSMSLTAHADELRAGSVAGLPEKLVVLDDAGRSVSENGEYFFEVENMREGETYTKKIQIMNLREGSAYHIFFNAEPISKSGEIDLEDECDCEMFLDDELIYKGKVTGEGEPDMRKTPLDLGLYYSGRGRTLKVNITWHYQGSGSGVIDNGYRIYHGNNVEIVREKTGKDHIEGEVIFKWIFTAVTEETSDPEHSSYVDTGETITFIAVGVVAVAIVIMSMLVVLKRKKKENDDPDNPNGPDGPDGGAASPGARTRL